MSKNTISYLRLRKHNKIKGGKMFVFKHFLPQNSELAYFIFFKIQKKKKKKKTLSTPPIMNSNMTNFSFHFLQIQ